MTSSFFKKLFFCFLTSALCAPAFAQTLTGTYEMLGRRCENSKKMAPPDDATVGMTFRSNETFRMTFFHAPSAATFEEIEEHREDTKDRIQRYLEEDKQTHEEACREHGSVFEGETDTDLCEPSNKRRFYARLEKDRKKETSAELARLEEIEENTGPCSMTLNGRYETSGNRLTLFPGDFSASEYCGEQSYPPRASMTYYFEGPYLYLVNAADSNSRKHCGSSDWAEILLKK